MSFIGVLFNSETMTIGMTEPRLKELNLLLRSWLDRENATLRDIQSLIGKLNFVASYVQPGRFFISRLIKWLKVYTLHSKSEFAKKTYCGGISFYLITMEFQ